MQGKQTSLKRRKRGNHEVPFFVDTQANNKLSNRSIRESSRKSKRTAHGHLISFHRKQAITRLWDERGAFRRNQRIDGFFSVNPIIQAKNPRIDSRKIWKHREGRRRMKAHRMDGCTYIRTCTRTTAPMKRMNHRSHVAAADRCFEAIVGISLTSAMSELVGLKQYSKP